MSRHDPIARVRRALVRAQSAGEPERGTVMTLATADARGRPSARMVLVKGVDERGFAFYTNYESRKARDLNANPHAALVLFWPTLRTQVRAEGRVERIPEDEADAYFASRPRQSQLGAWASRQSTHLESRRQLVGRYLREKARYLGTDVPRPGFWGGFLLVPARIEIWRSRRGRLHERTLYSRQPDGGWERGLLYP